MRSQQNTSPFGRRRFQSKNDDAIEMKWFRVLRVTPVCAICVTQHSGGRCGGCGCDGHRAGVLRSHPEFKQPVLAHYTG